MRDNHTKAKERRASEAENVKGSDDASATSNNESIKEAMGRLTQDSERVAYWESRESIAVDWIFNLLFFVYPGTCSIVFETFSCQPFEEYAAIIEPPMSLLLSDRTCTLLCLVWTVVPIICASKGQIRQFFESRHF